MADSELHIKKLLSELKFKFKCPKCKAVYDAKFGKNTCPNCQTIVHLEPKNYWGNLHYM